MATFIECRMCARSLAVPAGQKVIECPACGSLNTLPAEKPAAAPQPVVVQPVPEMATVCQRCKAPVVIPAGRQVVTCEYCDMVNARPQATGVEQQMLTRAKEELLSGHFQEAEEDFRYILRKYPTEHEALWGRLLCRYGVEYVRDTKTGRLMPTVHFTRPGVIQTEGDFKRACEHAPEEVARQYREDARYIDEVQAKIRERVKNDPGFDVFICHKTTRTTGAENGYDQQEFTPDYIEARNLYDELAAQRFRTFFAPKAGLKPGADYEAGIFHALDTARVMLLVCLNPAYLSTAWVKSEWSRYLDMQGEDPDKLLVPLYYGGVQEWELPEEIRLRKLQGIKMGELDSLKKIIALLEERIGRAYSPEEDFETLLSGSGCELLNYVGAGGEVNVPPTIRGRTVVGVAAQAFMDCRTVTEITLPESVSRVGEGAFRGCSALRSIRVVEDNAYYEVRSGALCSRGGELLCLPAGWTETEYDVPEGVRSIGAYAFFGCASLRRVALPAGVERLGDHAFAGCCDLEAVQLPAVEPQMGEEVFAGCPKLADRDFRTAPDGMGGCVVTGYTGHASEVTVPGNIGGLRVTAIGEGAFENRFALTRVVLPEGIQTLGRGAFLGCSSLKEVVLPQSLREIGEDCFGYCERLRELRLPAGMADFPENALRGCDSLSSLELPAEMTCFTAQLTRYCPRLTLRVRRESPAHARAQELGLPFTEVFSPESDFETETLREGCVITKYLGKETDVIVPQVIRGEKVTVIGTAAFHACLQLRSVTLPEGLTTLGRSAFYGCGSLQSVLLPGSLTQISWRSFGSCASLMKLTIPDSVTRIEGGAFDGCGLLTLCGCMGGEAEKYAQCGSVRFEALYAPEKDFETSMERGALRIDRYKGGASVVLVPEKIGGQPVQIIGNAAFRKQTGLERVVLPESVRMIGWEAFMGCTALREVNIPAQVRLIGERAFAGCAALEGVMTLPQGMTGLEEELFEGCTSLRGIVLPPELRSIGERTFRGCVRLIGMEIPPTVQTIGLRAFEDCRALRLRVHSDSVGERYAQKHHIPADVIVHYTEEKDFTTRFAGQGCVLTGYTGKAAKLRISPVIRSRVLTEIDKGAFRNKQTITSVVLPEGVEKIGDNAFDGCIALERVVIPASMTEISNSAFRSCRSLREIVVAEKNPVYTVSGGLLMNRDGTLLRCLPGFAADMLTLPAAVKKIGAGAFEACGKVKLIEFHMGVEKIAGNAFEGCPATLRVPAGSPAYAHFANKHIACEVIGDVSATLFRTEKLADGGCSIVQYKGKELKYVSVPAEIGGQPVRQIGVRAFANHRELFSVTLPDGVRGVGAGAFKDCRHLTLAFLPEGLEKIGLEAFSGCDALTLHGFEGSLTERYARENGILFQSRGKAARPVPEKPEAHTDAPVPVSKLEFETMTMETGSCAVIRYNGRGGDVTIPQQVWDETVRQIGVNAFAQSRMLRRVMVPATVTTISGGAFANCTELESVMLPPSVIFIAEDAFRGCGSVTIYGHAGSEAERFAGRRGIAFVPVGGAAEKPAAAETDASMFGVSAQQADCHITRYRGNAAEVTVPGSIGGKPVLRIGVRAFAGKDGVRRVTLPATLERICTEAFADCAGLTEVRVHTSLEQISADAFKGSDGVKVLWYSHDPAQAREDAKQLSAVTTGKPLSGTEKKAVQYTPADVFTTDLANGGCRITGYTGSATLVRVPPMIGGVRVNAIAPQAFNSKEVKQVELPLSVKTIGEYAFMSCTKLTHISMPGVTTIGHDAFSTCHSLWSVKLSPGLTVLPARAFYGCVALERIELPEGLESIGQCAFGDCVRLAEIVLPRTVDRVDEEAFRGCTRLRRAALNGTLSVVGSGVFSGCTGLETAELGYAVQQVGHAMFKGTALKKIHIPLNVKAIGSNAFEDCKQLTEVTFAEGVTTIGGSAFLNCTALRQIILPRSVTGIGMFLFKHCTALESADIRSQLTLLSEYTFCGCTKLTKVNLPPTLEKIDAHAFDGCSALAALDIPAGVKSFGINVFDGCDKLPASIRNKSPNRLWGKLGKAFWG